MNNKINIGIIGGAGYTGGELIRLLLNHPNVDIKFVHSKSNAGNHLSKVHQDLIGETELIFSGEINQQIDLLFLCLGHGESTKFLESNDIDSRIKIVDLANDFRIKKNALFQGREFIYGLPELNKQQIKEAHNIANPGCFATAIQLGLLPLAQQNNLSEIYTTGITGSTGAGQSLSSTSHFSWRVNNIQAYKTLTHQHLSEINQSINQLQSTDHHALHFVPWRGDFARGIFVSSTLKCDLDLEALNLLFASFYKDHPFVHVSTSAISLKQVVNTNKCVINIEKLDNTIVIHTAIDNLLKGASGQAIQNMNIMFGLDEKTGLHLKPQGF